jgi:hypothetical protein
MKTSPRSISLAALFSLALLVGCNSGTEESTADGLPETPPATVDTGDGHDHPSEGPHGGELIELGNEEYHAELIHPEGHDENAEEVVTIYILDGSAKETVPIEAAEVTINISHDGTPEQFKLAASPDEGDTDGLSSRFVSSEQDLVEHLHEEEIEFRLVVDIKGKSYNGQFHHHHHH